MAFIDGVRMVDLGDVRNERKLEREIFLKKNPECLMSSFDDIESETSSIASYNVRPNPHFRVKGNNSKEYKPFKDNSSRSKHKPSSLNLQTLWANGGPVKLLQFPCDEAQGTLCFKNYQHLDPEGVSNLVISTGCSFLSLKEIGDDFIKVRLKTEDDTRKLYNFLKMHVEYDVIVLLDMDDYQASKKKECHLKKIAKLRGYKYTSHQKMSEKDILSKIDKMNEIDSQIKFDYKPPSSLSCRSKENLRRTSDRKCSYSSYFDEDITRVQNFRHGRLGNNGSEVKKYSHRTPEEPFIGTWNGHTVVKPAIPAPILSKRPMQTEKKEDSIRKLSLHRAIGNNTNLLKYSSNSSFSNVNQFSHFNKLSNAHLASATEDSSSDTPQDVWICSDIKRSSYPSEKKKPHKKKIRNRQDFQPEKCAYSNKSPPTEYPSSSESFNESLRVGTDQVEGEEADEPKLLSIFDIFVEVMKRNILNNLETSFVVVKGPEEDLKFRPKLWQ